MWQGVEACDRGGGRVWVHVAMVVTCGRVSGYGIDGDMWQGWGHMVGCGGMWQGLGTCAKGGGRVWGHVTGGEGTWYWVRPLA